MAKPEAAAKIVARGKVQGVGFRYYILQRAQEMRLRGFTRNTPSGEVEVFVEGDKVFIEDMYRVMQKGPSAAKVTDTNIYWTEPTDKYRTFEIKR